MSITTTRNTTTHQGDWSAGWLGEFEYHTCGGCGVTWGLARSFVEQRRADGKTWYCPNGHHWHFTLGKSTAEKLREEREETARLRARLDQERAHARALKGVVTKTKKRLVATEQRVANGVCPCCNRSFKQLQRHMKAKHPDYIETGATE